MICFSKNTIVASIMQLLSFAMLTGQAARININPLVKFQTIDGFGAHQSDQDINSSWLVDLYYNDLECSIYRVDLTPRLKSPYSDLNYYSPWFMGSATKHVFNLEDPANPNGPEGNRVRTYTGPQDYSRSFGGRNAPIAVMGPDIEKNLQYFIYNPNALIEQGKQRRQALGDFKLIGSFWSPLPWVKIASGNVYRESWWPGPVANTPWPFVWGGNFAGGRLDVSNTPLQVFNDLNQGGQGPTSALTQFARSTAAYVLGYQRFHQVSFYAISIQNELNFEQFYNSATYPLSSQYIAALVAVRKAFDAHPELRNIQLMGPEDLLGGDAYGMWEYGSSNGPIHKNLQYLQNIQNDSAASRALAFHCIHGYASDGVTSSGAQANLWNWWVNGWTTSPAAGIPANVKGFRTTQKKSWMTETSGEHPDWLYPKQGYPGDGAFGLALRIHQALTTGLESAWIYWTFSDSDNNGQVSAYGLTNVSTQERSPKYNAAKHFFKWIRPGSVRIDAQVQGTNNVLASAYLSTDQQTLTCILLNTSASEQSFSIKLPSGYNEFKCYTSRENTYWSAHTLQANFDVLTGSIPPYSVTSCVGKLVSSNVAFGPTELQIEVIPNPMTDRAYVQFKTEANSNLQIGLYDLYGNSVQKLVHHKSSNSGKQRIPVDLQNLIPGVYFLHFKIGQKTFTYKMVKQ